MSLRNRKPPLSYCPHCGTEGFRFNDVNRFQCDRCGFVFFHNTAAACGAILTVGDGEPGTARILLLRRAREPARGMLDFPGGFIDPGESAETALVREIREEAGLEAADLRYFCSEPNQYEYRGVLYHTCDLIFTGTVPAPPTELEEAEISGFVLLEPDQVDLREIAFPSLRRAMNRYLRERTI